ncbi:uncharacterized protein LOC141630836 [Silene latifolia]|uniref:uncharacterized protein LOC141630836 n=1 Tax=Silene latifolia TaxID=37657 RepID=UPI003D78285C
MGCWAIWEARNGWVFENKGVDVTRVAKRVRSLLREMQEESSGGESNTQVAVGVERLEKPMEGFMKLNIDAGVKEGWGAGFGVVCRGSVGVVKWRVSERRREVMEPRLAEAEAMLIGVTEARKRGLTKVVFESDCKVLIEALKKQEKGRSDFHLIIEDILSFCDDFLLTHWSFVSRKLNSVAHELAHLSSLHPGRRCWGNILRPPADLCAVSDLHNIS